MKLFTLALTLLPLFAGIANAAAMTPVSNLIAKDQDSASREMCGQFCVGPHSCHGKCNRTSLTISKTCLLPASSIGVLIRYLGICHRAVR
ncbi:uncharacterized protein BO97DRAFT_447279 [Aspergillus homomorphus CBS 101889]|uniref:Uncharacterized protein n=1 Tax=Aspergillus homomorphus (strain CBS 101889) TaxID=1450537 RepID=A0A395HG60_ASPHC|nr:hypothetical protein BO97DRAFT_447279 [Aspergillus homomorphus CBS 101889]RAL06837.1 hypothetical protein BO97DRAFT_447279 [Aspergillus homomorphus CBS 101889]